jgi:transposase
VTVARPSKLSVEVTERVVQAIRAGNYPEAACQAAGISPSTYYRWISRGDQEPGSAHAAFREAVVRAEAEAEVHAVAIVRRAMGEDWRAAIAYLERRHPTRWRTRHQTELVGRDGGPIHAHHTHLDLTRLSDTDLETLEELTRRASLPS